MREKGSVIPFCGVTAATMLMGATVFASSSAQAVPGYSGLKTAIQQASVIQEARYTCRGSNPRRCYYVAPPARSLGYDRSGWGGRYRAEANYPYYQWGSVLNDGGR